jgi:hypothetical protein
MQTCHRQRRGREGSGRRARTRASMSGGCESKGGHEREVSVLCSLYALYTFKGSSCSWLLGKISICITKAIPKGRVPFGPKIALGGVGRTLFCVVFRIFGRLLFCAPSIACDRYTHPHLSTASPYIRGAPAAPGMSPVICTKAIVALVLVSCCAQVIQAGP